MGPLTAALLLVVLLTTACGSRALRAGPNQTDPAGPISPVAPAGRLQEVPPPGAVAQLQKALASHHPGVRIQAPADNSLLKAGPWTLELAVRDWPLADAGELGLGAHLVVQIDDQAPIRLSQGPAPGATSLRLELPELGAGSHRVSAYAARPWGEAVKDPGAFDQIRLARVNTNPLSQPAPGSPQLIPSASLEGARHQPVLVDWLLRDAPLQGLRPGDGSWRLRITVNGDSFLVDDSTPLWLRGWRTGSNAVLLELVDGQGAPLNPPFNSLVREVWIDPLAPAAAWEAPSLSAQQLAQLLGEQPVEPASGNAEESGDQQRGEPEGDDAGLTAMPGSEPTPAQQNPAEPALPDDTETAGQPERASHSEQSRQPEQSEQPEPDAQPAAQQEPQPAAVEPELGSAPMDSRPTGASSRQASQADASQATPERQGPLAGLRQRWAP
ncbi:putative conserved secreted protein [Cyanobium sp. NS01]|nr:putative conserved secreted protein [Cyanobium sp. NS01]